MEEGREPRTGSGRPPHETLVERIVRERADQPAERRARIVIEAIAELAAEDPTRVRPTIWRLLADAEAQARLATWLGCPEERAAFILAGASEATLSLSASNLRLLPPALALWL